jgi:hypothetical protein
MTKNVYEEVLDELNEELKNKIKQGFTKEDLAGAIQDGVTAALAAHDREKSEASDPDKIRARTLADLYPSTPQPPPEPTDKEKMQAAARAWQLGERWPRGEGLYPSMDWEARERARKEKEDANNE